MTSMMASNLFRLQYSSIFNERKQRFDLPLRIHFLVFFGIKLVGGSVLGGVDHPQFWELFLCSLGLLKEEMRVQLPPPH